MTSTDHPHPETPATPARGPRPPLPPRAPRRAWLTALGVGAVVAVVAYLLMPNQGNGPVELDGDPELAGTVAGSLAGAEPIPQGLVVLTDDAGGQTAQVTGGTTDGETPVTVDTPFETGSVFKVFTAMVLADMVENGETTLDRTVGEIYPEVDPADPRVADITLEELATHHSGLPRVPDDGMLGGTVSAYTQTDPYRTFADPADSLATTRLVTPDEYAYSNLGYAVLGEALARESGTPYPELVHERVLNPVGMDDTFILGADTDTLPTDAALPHVESGSRTQPWRAPHYAAVGAGTWSTAADLMRFATAVRDGAAPGMAALETLREVPAEVGLDDVSVGLAWTTSDLEDGSEMTFHSGGTYGSSAFVAIQDDRAAVAFGTGSPLLVDVSYFGIAAMGETEGTSVTDNPLFAGMWTLVAQTLVMTLVPPLLALTLVMRRRTLVGQRTLDRLRVVSMPLGATAVLLAAQRLGSWAATPAVVWAVALGGVAAALVVGVWLWPHLSTVRARWRWLRLTAFGLSVVVSLTLGSLMVWGLAVSNLG